MTADDLRAGVIDDVELGAGLTPRVCLPANPFIDFTSSRR